MERKEIHCPVCKKVSAWEENPFRPFCSDRCRLIDLGKWAAEEYRVAVESKSLPKDEADEKNRSKQ